MKNGLLGFLILAASFVHSANCEVWPVYSIFDLCLISDKILEAKFLEQKNDNYVFLTKRLSSELGLIGELL